MGVKVYDGVKFVSPNGLTTKIVALDNNGMLTNPAPIDLTSGQIKFPATQVASSDANTLDDYEEGTFTPILATDSSNPTSVSYLHQSGYYTKIGNNVTVSGALYFTTYSGGIGNIAIGNMPFVPSHNTSGIIITEYISFPASKTQANILCIANTNYALLEFMQSGSAFLPYVISSAAPSNATLKQILFMITYQTT